MLARVPLAALTITSILWLVAAQQQGSYILQVIVSDGLAKSKQQISSQWIDFEIVK